MGDICNELYNQRNIVKWLVSFKKKMDLLLSFLILISDPE